MKQHLILFSLIMYLTSFAQQNIGDPGVTFDTTLMDPDYPEMAEWITAGVIGGIPHLSNNFAETIEATNSDNLQKIIDNISNNGGGQVLLKNGIFTIDKTLNLKEGVILVGESLEGTILNITLLGEDGCGIYFNCKDAAICRLTVQGGYGTPTPYLMENSKPEFTVNSINFGSSCSNSWLDNVKILNSGNSAISMWKASHVTVRNCYIQGAWNKGGGGRGYVQFAGDHCLMTNTIVRHMRHIAIQREGAKYNVFYKNNVEQDFNFHNADAGFNLIEQNVSRLPKELDEGWHAMMGPWSIQHDFPGKRNAIFKNDCIEYNNDSEVTFSNPYYVYVPARFEKNNPFDITMNIPIGGTFYPIILKESTGITNENKDVSIQVYPQPCTKGILNIKMNNKINQIEVFDLYGKKIYEVSTNGSSQKIDMTSWSAATYLLAVSTDDGTIHKSIIIN